MEKSDQKKCEILIDKSIDSLKNQDIETAYTLLSEAYKIDPNNKRIFYYSGILGIGRTYEFSMRYFLAYAHLILNDLDNNKVFNSDFFLKHFSFDGAIEDGFGLKTSIVCNEGTVIDNNQVYNIYKEATAMETNIGRVSVLEHLTANNYMVEIEKIDLSKIIYELDFLSIIGVVYLAKHTDRCDYHKISKETMLNEIKHIQGSPSENIIRGFEHDNMLRIIGLTLLAQNLVPNQYLSNENEVSVYFSNDFSIDDI